MLDFENSASANLVLFSQTLDLSGTHCSLFWPIITHLNKKSPSDQHVKRPFTVWFVFMCHLGEGAVGKQMLPQYNSNNIQTICGIKLQTTNLRDAVFVRDHADNIIQRQQGVALDLGVDVFALRADGQQLHQVDVVHERAIFIHSFTLRTHHLDQSLEGGPVIIKHQDILPRVHQLQEKREI